MHEYFNIWSNEVDGKAWLGVVWSIGKSRVATMWPFLLPALTACCYVCHKSCTCIALFPGSPLAPTKNKNISSRREESLGTRLISAWDIALVHVHTTRHFPLSLGSQTAINFWQVGRKWGACNEKGSMGRDDCQLPLLPQSEIIQSYANENYQPSIHLLLAKRY